MVAANEGSGSAGGLSAESFDAWIADRARRYGQRPALIAASRAGLGTPCGYADLDRESAALAASLHGLGLRSGDALAIWLPNRPEWLIAHLATARLGLLTLPLNTWYRDSELAHFIGLTGCRAVLVDSAFRGIAFDEILANAFAALGAAKRQTVRHVLDWNAAACSAPNDWPPGVQRVRIADLAPVPGRVRLPSAASDATIVYATSGTTSAPKLALHAEGALLAHADAVAARAHLGPGDVALGALPPCGAYGYGLLLAALTAGGRAVMMDEFDVDLALELIESERVTVAALTEPLVRRLFQHPLATRARLGSLRLVFSAGATLEPVVERAEREFGVRITNVYGSSECLALAAFWRDDSDVRTRSAAGGRLVSHGMQVRVADADGRPVSEGVEGELQFRGPVLSPGYFADPDASARARTPDGWFRSQDLGRVVDAAHGEFHYISRMNDALRLKGFLVSPGEIESMLHRHPGVAAAQVVGVPGPEGDELAAAFVIPRAETTARATAEDLRQFCRARMASYKVPALIEIVDAFPVTRSANGDKVIKARLREIAQERLTS